MKSSKWIGIGICIVGAGVFWTLRHAEKARLRSQVEAQAMIKVSPASAGPHTGEPDAEVVRLRGLRPELFKLRAQVKRIRELSTLEPAGVDERATTRQAEAEIIQAWLKSEDDSSAVMQGMNLAVMAVLEGAALTQQPVPGSMSEARSMLEKAAADGKRAAKGFLAALDNPELQRLGVGFFELIPLAEPITPKPQRHEQEILFLREREPRKLPDGRFVRAYAWVNGATEQVLSDTGDFSAWEREHATSRRTTSR